MTQPIRSFRTRFDTVILLCGKCARKMDGGYGPNTDQSLKTAIRSELKAGGRLRQVRIVETRCLGICPKKAVTAINASAPDRILTLPKGISAGDALANLLPGLPSLDED